MATKFTQFLKDNGIDPRRVLVASRKIERLRPTDRAARLRKRVSKGAGAEASEATKAAPAARGEPSARAEKKERGRPQGAVLEARSSPSGGRARWDPASWGASTKRRLLGHLQGRACVLRFTA
jgi:hypothetical protein